MIATSPLRTIRQGCIVCLVVSGGFFNAAHAIDQTWNGGGANDNWSEGNNWGGTAPATDGTGGLLFGGSARLTPNNDFVGATFNKIYFNAGAEAFVLDGNAIRLQNVSNGIRNVSAVEQTINLDIELLDSSIPFSAIGAELTINGVLSGVGGILPSADGWLNLNGANTFTGGISLSGSGARKLRVGHASGLGAGTLTVSGGQLAFKAGIGEFTVGRLAGTTGAFNLEDEDEQGITLKVTGSGSATRGSVMSGTGALKISMQPGGVQILTGTNTYTGGTIIESGTLELNGASGNIASSGALIINGGTLSIQRGTATKSVTVASLNGIGGEIVANTNPGGAVTFTVNTTSDDAFAGVLRDGTSSLILNKSGSGTLTLSGDSTHTGPDNGQRGGIEHRRILCEQFGGGSVGWRTGR